MNRGAIMELSADDAVDRAVSMLGRTIAPIGGGDALPLDYKLGRGGKDPRDDNPGHWSSDRNRWTCDCMGFVAWCLGFDRFQKQHFDKDGAGNVIYGGWINTDSMLLSSKVDEPSWFERIDVPEPGAVLVYGARWKNRRRVRIGHTGIIVSVPETPELDWSDLGVVHCSSSAARRRGDAIAETDGKLWARRGAILRYVRTSP